jgi:hypothetical protein
LPATSYRIFSVLTLFYQKGGLTINKMHDYQHLKMSSSAAAGTLQNTNWQSCIDACMNCAEAYEFCAISDLKEQDVKMMVSCAQINRDFISVCWTCHLQQR